jgi:hypothetical protein
MTSWATLERFLRTDPADIGCGQAMEILHVYVDLVAADPRLHRRVHSPSHFPAPQDAAQGACCRPSAARRARRRHPGTSVTLGGRTGLVCRHGTPSVGGLSGIGPMP